MSPNATSDVPIGQAENCCCSVSRTGDLSWLMVSISATACPRLARRMPSASGYQKDRKRMQGPQNVIGNLLRDAGTHRKPLR